MGKKISAPEMAQRIRKAVSVIENSKPYVKKKIAAAYMSYIEETDQYLTNAENERSFFIRRMTSVLLSTGVHRRIAGINDLDYRGKCIFLNSIGIHCACMRKGQTDVSFGEYVRSIHEDSSNKDAAIYRTAEIIDDIDSLGTPGYNTFYTFFSDKYGGFDTASYGELICGRFGVKTSIIDAAFPPKRMCAEYDDWKKEEEAAKLFLADAADTLPVSVKSDLRYYEGTGSSESTEEKIRRRIYVPEMTGYRKNMVFRMCLSAVLTENCGTSTFLNACLDYAKDSRNRILEIRRLCSGPALYDMDKAELDSFLYEVYRITGISGVKASPEDLFDEILHWGNEKYLEKWVDAFPMPS